MSRELQQGLSLSAVITIVPEQVSCDIRGEVVVLNVRDGVYYGLTAVAARVWQLLDQPRTVEMIRDTLLDEFKVEREECTRNLIELLIQLKDRDLIQTRNGAGG